MTQRHEARVKGLKRRYLITQAFQRQDNGILITSIRAKGVEQELFSKQGT